MSLRLGFVSGLNLKGTGISATTHVINTTCRCADVVKQIEKIRTTNFYKPLKVECEFCKEKIGLLNDDVFQKQISK